PEKRFDFGAAVLAAKADGSVPLGRNKILSNEFHVRAKGVLLMAADENRVSDNLIEWDGSAVGIHVARDSDRNHCSDNVLISSARPARFVREFLGTNLIGAHGADIGVLHADPIFQTLQNVIIGGRVLQFTAMGGPRLEDNLCESNTITLPGPHVGKNHGGIV